MLLEKGDRPGGEWSGGWHGQYILDDDRNPVPCYDLYAWGKFMEDVDKRKVGVTYFPRTKIFPGPRSWRAPRSWPPRVQRWGPNVSTVFLGLDHNFANMTGEQPMYKPILFETMIFGTTQLPDYQDRCCTWAEAEQMHEFAVAQLRIMGWRADIVINMIGNLGYFLGRQPWGYWRDRVLNRWVYITIEGRVHRAFKYSTTQLRLLDTNMGKITVTTNNTAGIPGVAPRGVDKWLLKCLSAASRTRSVLSGLSSIRLGRTRKTRTTSRSQ